MGKLSLFKKDLSRSAKRTVVFSALFALFFIVANVLISLGVIDSYISQILVRIGINIILAVSLNIVVGYLGQLPLGHAGFMAVGAYAGAIFLRALPEDTAKSMLVPAVIIGGVVAALFGMIIGLPALRLRGDYLAIITLGFGEIIRILIINIDSVLGFDLTYGAASLKNIPKINTFFSTFICVAIVCVLITTLMRSRHGRAILAIRDNEIAAESCGINIMFYKTLGFTLSAFFAGVAGALYATTFGILTPSSFGFMKSIEILVMVVFGGIGSMVGSVVSATVLTALPQFLSGFEKYNMLLYSLVLIIVMVFGNSPKFANLRTKFKNIFKKRIKGRRKS